MSFSAVSPQPRPAATDLCALARERSLAQPEKIGFTFLADGETEEQNLTYGELDRQARALAGLLQKSGRPGDRALLLFDPGLDYVAAFFGAIYAGLVPVPAYPPDLMRAGRTLPRLRALAEDCRPKVVLGTRASLALVRGLLEQAVAGTEVVAVDGWREWVDLPWAEPELGPESLALLQYTSGSTTAPRGVMVTHGNLLYQLEFLNRRAPGWHSPVGEQAVGGVSWLPLYHDLGLIAAVLVPFYNGHRVVTMSPLAFVQRPLRWLQAMSRYRAVATGGPNFAYDLCVSKFRPEDAEGLDLSNWRVALSGAEPIRNDTLERFTKTFAPYGFSPESWLPTYGLAEATLGVTGFEASSAWTYRDFAVAALELNEARLAGPGERSRRLVACGRALEGTEVIVADPQTGREVGAGAVGEVWVRGPGVALGYWGRPEETAVTFGARTADTQAGPYLRTGDYGFLHEGLLYITGRLKETMIFWGRNVYPQDVEHTVAGTDAALRQNGGAAFSVERDGEERLVVVQEVSRPGRLDLAALAAAVRQAVLDEHRLPLHALALIQTGTLPKTTSGKIQRAEARRRFLNDELSALKLMLFEAPVEAAPEAPDGPAIFAWLRARLASACGVPEEQITGQEPLNQYVLDSISLVALARDLEAWLGRSVPPTVLFEVPTLESLARRLAEPTSVGAAVEALSEGELDQALAQLLGGAGEAAPRPAG